MEYIKLIIKGFIVGLGKIIPGVSGGMLAIILGVYENSIHAVAHFFSEPKRNSIFLGFLGFGAIWAIIGMSGLIGFFLEHHYLPTMLLFIGLMLGGFSSLKKEVEGTNYKKYLGFLLFPFIIMLLLHYTNGNTIFVFDGGTKSILMLFLFGMIDAVTMIVPGVSGTAILMLLGCYTMLLETFSNLLDFTMITTSLRILIPFGLGIMVGAYITVRIVSYLLKRRSIAFHYTIISCFFSSIFLLLLQTMEKNYSILTILIGFLCLLLGYIISKLLNTHYNL